LLLCEIFRVVKALFNASAADRWREYTQNLPEIQDLKQQGLEFIYNKSIKYEETHYMTCLNCKKAEKEGITAVHVAMKKEKTAYALLHAHSFLTLNLFN